MPVAFLTGVLCNSKILHFFVGKESEFLCLEEKKLQGETDTSSSL